MNGKRSRSGCLTCRRRHHKCDESKPTCLNCRLRGAKCEGYGITLSDFTVRDGFNGQMVARAVRGSPRERPRKRLKTPSEGSNHSDNSPDIEQSTAPNDSGVSESQHVQQDWQIDPITTQSSPTDLPDSMNIIPVDGAWWNSPAGSRAATPSVLMDLPVVADSFESLDWTLPDLVEDDNIDETRDAASTSTVEEGLLQLMDKPVLWSTPDDPFDQYLFSHYMDNLSLRLYPVTRPESLQSRKTVSTSEPQVSCTSVITANPGVEGWGLRRQDECHHVQHPEKRETDFGILYAATDITRENGAVRVVIESNNWTDTRDPHNDEETLIELRKGDAILTLGSVYYGQVANTTTTPSTLLVAFATPGYRRQEENQYLAVPWEVAEKYPTAVQRFLG